MERDATGATKKSYQANVYEQHLDSKFLKVQENIRESCNVTYATHQRRTFETSTLFLLFSL